MYAFSVTAGKDYRLNRDFVTPYTPEQSGTIERFFSGLKEVCVWLQDFDDFELGRSDGRSLDQIL